MGVVVGRWGGVGWDGGGLVPRDTVSKPGAPIPGSNPHAS